MENSINAALVLSFLGGGAFLFILLFFWYLVSSTLKKDKLINKEGPPVPTPLVPETTLVLKSNDLSAMRGGSSQQVLLSHATSTDVNDALANEKRLHDLLNRLFERIADMVTGRFRKEGAPLELMVQLILGEAQAEIDGFNRSVTDKDLIKKFAPYFHVAAANIAMLTISKMADGHSLHLVAPKLLKFAVNNFGMRELTTAYRQAQRFGYVRVSSAMSDFIIGFFGEIERQYFKRAMVMGVYAFSIEQDYITRDEFEAQMRAYILTDRFEKFIGRIAVEMATKNFDEPSAEHLVHEHNRKRRGARIRQRNRNRGRK